VDAIVMLKEDHKQVEQLFKKLEKGDLSVVPAICDALALHAQLEELLFYPEVRAEVQEVADDVDEAVEEHHVVKLLVGELQEMSDVDEAYKAKATVLMELVRHHVEEEEGEMFPEVRSALGRKRLQEIGEEMAAAKDRVAAA
jgi:hemerythrin superfamily protein